MNLLRVILTLAMALAVGRIAGAGGVLVLDAKSISRTAAANSQAMCARGTAVGGMYSDGTKINGFLFDRISGAFATLQFNDRVTAVASVSQTRVLGLSPHATVVVGDFTSTSDGKVHGFIRDAAGHFHSIDLGNGTETHVTGATENTVVGYFKDSSAENGFLMDIHDGTFTKYTIIRIPSASDTRVRAIDGYRLVGTYTPSPPGALVNGYILCWPQFFVEPPFGYTTVAYPSLGSGNQTWANAIVGDLAVGEVNIRTGGHDEHRAFVFDIVSRQFVTFQIRINGRTYEAGAIGADGYVIAGQYYAKPGCYSETRAFYFVPCGMP